MWVVGRAHGIAARILTAGSFLESTPASFVAKHRSLQKTLDRMDIALQ
jgi:hypothetical protein